MLKTNPQVCTILEKSKEIKLDHKSQIIDHKIK